MDEQLNLDELKSRLRERIIAASAETGEEVSPEEVDAAITQYYALSSREGGSLSVGACPFQVVLDQVVLPTPFNLELLPSEYFVSTVGRLYV